MITLTQIKEADRIKALSAYYAMNIRANAGDPDVSRITSVSVLKISDRKVVNEAFLPIVSAEDAGAPENAGFSIENVAAGVSKLVLGEVVVAEPETVVLLRSMLDAFGYEGDILFLPACRLASAVFSSVSGERVESTAAELSIPDSDYSEELCEVYLEADIFERCRAALSGEPDESGTDSLLLQPPKITAKARGARPSASKKIPVSDETLSHWAKSAWTASPWVFGVIAILVLILAAVLLPQSSEKKVDRNVPPVSYLVLSWDETGKYGSEQKARAGEEKPIQFRIPYGVYSVLNNNSIPVELHIINENSENEEPDYQAEDDAVAAELNISDSADEEDQPSNSRVILRPNSTRQITIDTDQYLTLSEDAKDLIFFYQSPVPEEPESDTTGQVHAGQSVIYAYVKGTEVRFRRAPSLEGQIIDTLNNGQQVQVLAISGEWTHVQIRDQKGYIFSQYLTTEDPNQKSSSSPSAESSDAGQASEESTEAAPSESVSPDSAIPAADDLAADEVPESPDEDLQESAAPAVNGD